MKSGKPVRIFPTNIREKSLSKINSINSVNGEDMKLGIVKEFFQFLFSKKKYWLIPVIIILLLLGILVVLTEGTAIAPFIYTLF